MENQNSENYREDIIKLVEEIKKIIRNTFKLGEEVANEEFEEYRAPYHFYFSENFKNELLKITKTINDEEYRELFQVFEYLVNIKYLSVLEKKISKTTWLEYRTNVNTYLNVQDENAIFIARAFNNPNTRPIAEKIKDLADEFKLQPIMLEDDLNIGNINSYIKNSIIKSKFVIVDITPREEKTNNGDEVYAYNPNVFFEAGIADGLNKKVIYIKNKDVKLSFIDQNLPFDISSHATLSYTVGEAGEAEFIKGLKKMILSVPNTLT